MNDLSGMSNVLKYFALKYDGKFDDMYKALENKEKLDPSLFEELGKKIKNPAVTIVDDNYPEMFKTKENPPLVLFYEGNLDLIDDNRNTKSAITGEGTRMTIGMDINLNQNGIRMDYVIACENQNDLEIMKSMLHDNGLKLKDYSRDSREDVLVS